MRRVLAVDGGQSTIRVRVPGVPAPVEVEGVSRQEGDVVGAVASAVIGSWSAAGERPVDRAVLGLTTAPSDAPSRQRLCQAVGDGVGAPEVWLTDDAVTSHAGALSLGWGVSVTAGTGVACLAMPCAGEPHLVGGHGFLLGDEGSAWWIGREGIRAVLRADDGRGAPTALAEPAARRFGGLDDLAERLHGVDRPVNVIAGFAPDVLAAADAGDAVARTIVEAGAAELLLLVRAATAAADADAVADSAADADADADPIPVALGGRLLRDGPLRRRLDEALASELPGAAARDADGSPLDGALLLGDEEDPGRYRGLVHVWQAAT